MNENDSQEYDVTKKLDDAAIPDDTITIVIKCGGKTFSKGVKMEESQEKTAILAGNMMQSVIDTVDAYGLKADSGKAVESEENHDA